MSDCVLVTGATGLVGRCVVARASAAGLAVRASARRSDGATPMLVADLSAGTDWTDALDGVDAVVHCAARVHQMNEPAGSALAAHRAVNVEGTMRLAEQAAQRGVRRFVFVSSIKVNGERTEPGRPFRPSDPPAPTGPYAQSKLEAEQRLAALGARTGLEIVVVRPVLVYGPGVRGNFAAMMRALVRGIPLPFGSIDNLRSFVAVDNLADLLLTCVAHPSAANREFLVSDGLDMATPELLRRTAAALGVRPRLFSVPRPLLDGAAALVGARERMRRLLDSLQVDLETTRAVLGWRPPVTVEEALDRTAHAFLHGAVPE